MAVQVQAAEIVRGIYGVPSVRGMAAAERERLVAQMGLVSAQTTATKRAARDGAGKASAAPQGRPDSSVNAVFVPAEAETIAFFKSRGFRVYVSVNAFGGRVWQQYPDARPVLADGRLLGERNDDGGHGGVCPTHEKWRSDRLLEIRALIERHGGPGGIDGIWLDFIRYPGFWEGEKRGQATFFREQSSLGKSSLSPFFPDACWCPRCLTKFSAEMGVKPPAGMKTAEAAAWIKNNHAYEWMRWKKEQIHSFVRDVRKLMQARGLKLGLFIVPWTKGERHNAVSYLLAQDAFALSQNADVISPMVYHRMVGMPPAWVGGMTAYFKETAACAVWPIVQSEETSTSEFSEAVRSAADGGADGILVYHFAKPPMMPPQKGSPAKKSRTAGKQAGTRSPWQALFEFKPLENLISNPEFHLLPGEALPAGWGTGPAGDSANAFTLRPAQEILGKRGQATFFREQSSLGKSSLSPFLALGIRGSYGPEGFWHTKLPACEPGREYRFEGLFHRDIWDNREYASISVWGRRMMLDQHWTPRTFQRLREYVRCPARTGDSTFAFYSDTPGTWFWMAKPHLVPHRLLPPAPIAGGFFYDNFFPIGIYGADISSLEDIGKTGINSVIIGADGDALRKTILECRRLNLRQVLSVPRDPDRLKVYLDALADSLGLPEPPAYTRLQDLAFYVNDEPELTSFPTNSAEDVQMLIKGRFPKSSTCMAVVRPRHCRPYLGASDFFMMDQYPYPYMPMTWLSDSMDEAARDTGADRLLSVIQAFREGENRPLMPGWQHMDCLAFLSVVHGSRGIFFYTWPEVGKTPEGRRDLGRVVGRLNSLYAWLLQKNLEKPVQVEMLSEHRFDPKGRPGPKHC